MHQEIPRYTAADLAHQELQDATRRLKALVESIESEARRGIWDKRTATDMLSERVDDFDKAAYNKSVIAKGH